MLTTFLSLAMLGVVLSGVGVALFRMGPRSDDDDPSGLSALQLVDRYLAQGRLMEAMVVAKKVVREHPHSLRPRMKLIHVYRVQGKLQRAVEEATELCALRPGSVDAQRHLADLTGPHALAGVVSLDAHGNTASSVGGASSSAAAPALRPPES